MTTYRVYARWPEQRVSDKTTTESRAVAMFAFQELVDRPWPVGALPVGIAITQDGKQLDYHTFAAANS
jgi:hypothetical protein